VRPRPTIRLRLTALYAGLFLLCGAVLLGLAYGVVREAFAPRVEAVATPAPTRGAVARAERPAEVERRVRAEEAARDERALRDVLVRFGAVLGLLTVGSVGVGWLAAGRALAPVSRIAATARRVSGRRLDERIALDGPTDELKELADTFDAMLDRLEAAFRSQRRFVADASHELRTPLAVIRAELEELEDTGPLPPDRQAMLVGARRAAARCERLIASLLTLARSEAELERRVPVDLAALTREALAGARGAPPPDMVVEAELGPAEARGDPVLLESLVVNLVENAVRHNVPRGRLRVATRQGGGWAQLVVENSGPPVDPREVEALFAPFARPEASRGIAEGSGLGLSIVRAVAAAHGGAVAAVPRDGGGLVVTVRLPVPELTVGEQGPDHHRDH
jgi:signal transduction histidine kinase